MKTISEKLFTRLNIQADEADVQGLTKIASHLTEQISKNEVRADDSKYLYSSAEFESDVESRVWDIVIRAADFYNAPNVDSKTMQTTIEKIAQELIQELNQQFGDRSGIGNYESAVPGELRLTDTIEISE